jgi:hypothetical protein
MDFALLNSTDLPGLIVSSAGQFAEGGFPGGPGSVETYDPAHWSITETAVPEPATWAMMGLGFAGIGALAYRGRRKATVAA